MPPRRKSVDSGYDDSRFLGLRRGYGSLEVSTNTSSDTGEECETDEEGDSTEEIRPFESKVSKRFYSGFSAFLEEAESDIATGPDGDEVVFMSWSPDPARYPSREYHEQYIACLRLLLQPSTSKVFRLFAWVPELTLQGNIHIHGWFVLRDKIKYFKDWLPKLKAIGRTYPTVQKYQGCGFDYYKKDIGVMSELLDYYDLPVPLTHLNASLYYNRFLPKPKLRDAFRPKQLRKNKLTYDLRKFTKNNYVIV